MSEKKHVRWLLDELPRLREQNLITAETENVLREHYAVRLTPGVNYFMLALGILGVALIGGGIILIFNYNWDMLGQAQQIGVSFLPLLLGLAVSLFTLIRGKSQLWREASAILTAAGGAVAVALLSQIYQLNGSLSDYMMLVLITSLPLIFIFDSIGLATLYSFGMFSLLEFGSPEWLRLLILAGIAVWLIMHLRKQSACRVYARYLSLPVVFYLSIQYAGHGCAPLMLFTIAALFLLLGCELQDEGETFWRNPWFPASFLLLTVMLAIGAEANNLLRTGPEYHRVLGGGRPPDLIERLVRFWCVESLFLIGLAWMLVRNFMKKKRDVFRVMIPLLMLFVAFGYVFRSVPETGFVCRVGMNCFMGAFGISLICAGIRKGSLLVFNQGMLLCTVLFTLRFLSADLGLVVRGIGMIAAGLIIIGSNVYLTRKNRSGKEAGHETK
ncbi:MAG: DUF2157 domain-containing protein [Lentisphaerae bacterium]|nr:DUF2157 domain-containing protein [Lentisphaerota bacterium]